MGVILCPEHGRAGIALVCPHLATNVDGAPTRVEVDLSGFKWPHWFCSDCLNNFALPESESYLLETVLKTHAEAFESLRAVCGTCFQARHPAELETSRLDQTNSR